MAKTLIPLIFLFLIISCRPVEAPAAFDRPGVEEAGRAMLQDYHRAIRENGLTAEFDYLDHSADFFWVPPGYTSALSYDSVRTILETNARAFRKVDFHWDTLEVFPLAADIATYTGIVRGMMTDTAGTASPVSIIESGTLIRRPDGWKLLSGQSRILEGK